MVQGMKMRYASGFTSNKAKFAAQEKFCGFQPDICSPSLIGAKRKQPGLLCQGASCVILCQLICHCGLIDHRTSQPLSLMVRSSVGSSHNSHLKPHNTEQQRKGEERGGGGKEVKPKPRLDSLPAVSAVKQPKVYCLSICRLSKDRLYSPRKPRKSSLTAWPSCVFMELGSNLTCFSFSAPPAKMQESDMRLEISVSYLTAEKVSMPTVFRSSYLPETSWPHSSVLGPAGLLEVCPAAIYYKTGFTVHYAITLICKGL